MLIRDAVRLTAISFLLIFQCVSPSLATSVQTSPVPDEQTRRSDDLGQSSTALVTKVGTYNQLLAAIREARAESRARVEQAKVREAWETGRLIDEHILHHKERAEYGARVIERLAKDLGSSRTELSYMLQFARDYKILPISETLTWSDYRELLSLKDPAKREEVRRRAVLEHWDVQRIRSEVKRINQLARTGVEPSRRLTAQPGIPYTYRVVPGVEEGERVIDLGFSNYYSPAGEFNFKAGDIVTASQNSKGSYTLRPQTTDPRLQQGSAASPQSAVGSLSLYTYEAKVLEVIDGDTVKAVVDLGFGFRTVQVLRLRGIDAPEIKTAEGVEAKKALEKMLQMPGLGTRSKKRAQHPVFRTSRFSSRPSNRTSTTATWQMCSWATSM